MTIDDIMALARDVRALNWDDGQKQLRTAIATALNEARAEERWRAEKAERVLLRRRMRPCDECGRWCTTQLPPIHKRKGPTP